MNLDGDVVLEILSVTKPDFPTSMKKMVLAEERRVQVKTRICEKWFHKFLIVKDPHILRRPISFSHNLPGTASGVPCAACLGHAWVAHNRSSHHISYIDPYTFATESDA